MRLTISTNFPDVKRRLDQLQDEVAAKATARAVNRTVEQAKTEMSRQIRHEYVVDARFVRSKLQIERANFYKGVLRIEASLYSEDKLGRERSINLIHFAARRVATGVSVKIKRAGGRKVVPGAFLGNKGRTVFARVPGTRMASRKWGKTHGEKIKPVQTINVPQMFNARRINAAVVAAMQAKFPAIFERELAYALASFNRT